MFKILTRISKNVDKCIDKFCDTLFLSLMSQKICKTIHAQKKSVLLSSSPLKRCKKIEGSKPENNLNTARHNMMKIF